MEVSLEVLGPTARALRVTVPQQRFAEQVENRLRQLSRTLRIKGFRPGKVPVQVVRQYHLAQVYGEVMEKLANDSLREALATEKVQPVVDPKVTVEEYGEDIDRMYREAASSTTTARAGRSTSSARCPPGSGAASTSPARI